MKIRKAKKGDLKEIAEIYRIESAKKPYNTKFDPSSALKEVVECFKGDIYLAEEENEIVGFIASHIVKSSREKAYIDEFWIKSDFQGRGLGGQLLDIIEKNYKKKEIKMIRLAVNKKARACDFYRKLKYRESKELVFFDKKL